MPVSSRKAAFNALMSFRRQGARPDIVLAHHGPEDARDRALAMNITYGVLQNETYLDYVLSACDGGTKKYRPDVREILRLSAYQILFLDRVPDRAAVSEGVELAKEYAPYAAGLINAVLRKVSAQGAKLDFSAGSREEYLSIRFSHPLWLVRELTDEYGGDVCEKILKANNTVPPVTVQVNTLRTTPRELRESLISSGITVTDCPLLDDALYITGTGAIEDLEEFKRGLFYVQDAASRFAVMASGVKPGDTVMDMCAAPGGKSFAAAIAMGNVGQIRSYDIHEKKAALIASGAERLGITVIRAGTGDARAPKPGLEGTADVVLTDVPCSGFGVIRKKPDIRLKKPEETARLPKIQLEILKSSSAYVKPGGRLVYSTCTILRRENEDVVDAFLRERQDFEKLPFSLPEPFGPCDGAKTILPFEGGTDGFFICVLRKK